MSDLTKWPTTSELLHGELLLALRAASVRWRAHGRQSDGRQLADGSQLLIREIGRLRDEVAAWRTAATCHEGPADCLGRMCSDFFDDDGDYLDGLDICSHVTARSLTPPEVTKALERKTELEVEAAEVSRELDKADASATRLRDGMDKLAATTGRAITQMRGDGYGSV